MGGDGSARLYRRVAAGTWVADNFTRPDTLRWDAALSEYVRTLPGRVEVRFDGTGNHKRTVNRQGHETVFTWSGGRLTHVYAARKPGVLDTGHFWRFDYLNNGGTRLSRVRSPGPADTGADAERFTVVATDPATGWVTAITDPDSTIVRFGYSGSPRVAWRKDRLGYQTDFRYNNGFRLAVAKLNLGLTLPSDSIVHRFTAQETRGLPNVGGAVVTTSAYTLLDGPRTDTLDYTYLWLDRWGAPVKIQNAQGKITEVARHDPRWPGLATRVQYPNGQVVTATYDARGNLESTTDWSTLIGGRYATTLYEFDPVWDAPTRVVAPAGEVTFTGYDALGRVEWQQPGPDPARRVRFAYNSLGLVESVTLPPPAGQTASPVQRFGYDSRGNLRTSTSPLGAVTSYHKDRLGRDTLVVSPVEGTEVAERRFTYDRTDRVRTTTDRGLSRNGFNLNLRQWESLTVTNEYDLEGRLRFTRRTMSPDSNNIGVQADEWRYDGAGRTVTHINTTGASESTWYNPTGATAEVSTRRECISGIRCVIRMRYDALGRLTERVLQEVRTYQQEVVYVAAHTFQFPRFPLDPARPNTPTVIAADTQRYAYDDMGNMTAAINRDAVVRRTYNKNGTLASETQRIRTYLGSDTTKHAYTLSYGYDLNGRRTTLTHPANLAPRAGSVVRYGYDPVTGDLASVTDLAGNTFAWTYDLQGNRATETVPGSSALAYTYDLDGRLRVRSGPNGAHRNDRYTYDLRGKALRVTTNESDYQNRYNGLGALVWSESHVGMLDYFHVTVDPLGNVIHQRTWATSNDLRNEQGSWSWSNPRYERGTGAFSWDKDTPPGTNLSNFESAYRYDRAGNRDGSSSIRGDESESINERSRFYYGADDKLRVADRRKCLFQYPNQFCSAWNENKDRDAGTFEEYRYDALGRRVMVRSRPDPQCTLRCVATIERYVWDGDEILYEIRRAGGGSTVDEQDTGVSPGPGGTPTFGRIAYTHGPGIDQPLSLVRMDYSGKGVGDQFTVVTHINWRGLPDYGTFPDGSTKKCDASGCTDLNVDFDWAAKHFTIQYRRPRNDLRPLPWLGSLILNKQDATGQIYMRNRYYDPQTGQFTQQDPIGLTGGLNAYGFADGDPVNFSDPYGLSAQGCCPKWLVDAVAGFGDAASFGLTAFIRKNTPGGDGVDYTSGAYVAGAVGGTVAVTIATYGAAGEAQGARATTAVRAPKPGSAGGPGAGRAFPTRVQNAARAESGNTCVFCGTRTARSRSPQPDRSNIDHAVPKSRGGNNTLENAQNTCQACNLNKGARTTEEYLRTRGGGQ